MCLDGRHWLTVPGTTAPVTSTGPDLSGPAAPGRAKIRNDALANRAAYLDAKCNDSFTADVGKIRVTATLTLLTRLEEEVA
jgi:hypothetical protein